MAENNEAPEPVEKPEAETSAEQNVGTEQPEVGKDAMNMAMLCHLLAIFTGFIGPLVVWLVKKEDTPFVDEHGKEALNFQITVLIAMFVSGLLTFACVGFVLMPIVWIADLVFCIIAAVKANNGQHYRYPLTIRLIK